MYAKNYRSNLRGAKGRAPGLIGRSILAVLLAVGIPSLVGAQDAAGAAATDPLDHPLVRALTGGKVNSPSSCIATAWP